MLKSFVQFLILAFQFGGLATLAQADPLAVFVTNRFVVYQDDPSSGYAREDYQWWRNNSGQDSRLFLNGSHVSSEPGGEYDLNLPEAWLIQPRADGVIVGIVDAGCQSNHEDMAGVILKGHTFNDRNHIDSDDYDDWNGGHGTLIAGIIAARHNDIGIAGIADGAKLLIVSTLYNVSEIAKGIEWCVTNGANIVCLSWGETGEPDAALSNACVFAGEHEVVIVSAVANSPVDLDASPTYPYTWHLPNVVEVSGLTREGVAWPVSAYGTNCISAPARVIVSTSPGSTYGYSSGNSFASPMVAGVLALMKAWQPAGTASNLVSALRRSNVAGQLDAYGALLALGATNEVIASPVNLQIDVE